MDSIVSLFTDGFGDYVLDWSLKMSLCWGSHDFVIKNLAKTGC